MISIHALREESDGIDNVPEKTKDISIHALREESDHLQSSNGIIGWISIHALREESDKLLINYTTFYKYFNPRSPRGERLPLVLMIILQSQFQSTLSARRATAKSNIIFTLKSTMYLHFFTKL